MNCLNCGKIIKSNRKYCSNNCQLEHKYKIYIDNWKKGKENGMRGVKNEKSNSNNRCI